MSQTIKHTEMNTDHMCCVKKCWLGDGDVITVKTGDIIFTKVHAATAAVCY